ncbi:hypothetical protein ABIA33_002095 [Streptacidiphilus sp. MAP12-16]|uniref:hypothetical protein n=1 Tax=Streptacidiphilus sp. MAP12-16 TaxID=3156300 RepID=UPI003519C65C
MAAKPKSAERKARIAAQQAAERARERRNKLLLRSGVAVAALAVVGGIVTVAVNSNHSSTSASGTARWSAPADAAGAVKAAGLPMLAAEGTAEHIHAHLDVYVDGKQVTVPALVGIDESANQLSPLHTHDTTGVVHIESPTVKSYSLGQFMKEWQVTLSGTQLGDAKTDATHTLTAYVDGKKVTGDPASIVLGAHDEIALVYGTASENATVSVPTSYAWTNGL